jgi:hypothetical protein
MPLYPARAAVLANVADFGASPSAIASVNDAAFAAAIASLPASGGAIVVPTLGTYQISVPIVIDKNYVSLVGFGTRLGCPTIQVTSADPSYAIIAGNTKNVAHCCIDGLNIQGLSSTTSTGAGINFRSGGGYIRNVQVKLFGGTGINLASFSGSVFEVFLDNVNLIQNGMNTGTPGDNLVISSDLSDCEYNRIISSGDAAKSTTRHGINNSGANQKFVDCHAYFCNQDGFRNTGVNTQIIGGEWETNGNRGIGSFNINVRVVGAYIYSNGNVGIDVNSDTFAIVGCLFQNNTNEDVNVNAKGMIADSSFSGTFIPIQIGAGTTQVCVHDNNIAATTSSVVTVAGTHCSIHNNIIASGGNIVEQTGANNNLIHDNDIISGTITLIGSATKLRNNQGYNPVGHGVTQPSVPATTVAQTNTTGVDCTVIVTGGTVSAIAIGGSATGVTSGSFRVPVGQTITLTYTVAPTWQWFGD